MSSGANRAGHLVRQPSGYESWMPAPLPPDPPIQIDATLQSLLADANLALGRLDGSVQTLPDPDLFVYMYVRREAVLSSQIEGTQSSLQDLLAAEAKINAEIPSDVDEVINYVAAMNFGVDRLKQLPVSTRLLRELHAILMQGVRGSHLTPGEIRTSQNWIGRPGATLNQAIYVPPAPRDVPEALSNLEQFLHQDDDIPFLIKVGLAHAQFETIHPFLDGNGRLGRLLITFLMCERGVLSKPVLYLSWYLKRNRSEYYAQLQNTREEAGWEQWLAFFLRGVIEVSAEAAQTSRSILMLKQEDTQTIIRQLSPVAAHALLVLDYLYQHPIISAEVVRTICNVSNSTAHRIVQRLLDVGILVEITGNARNRRFQYDAYVRLFSD